MERSQSAPARRLPSLSLDRLNQTTSSLSPNSSFARQSSSSPKSNSLVKAQKHIDQLLDSEKLPASWNSRDVGDWLEVIGFPQYRRMFISRGVDGYVLLSITPGIFDQVGVRNLGHQKRILDKIAELKEVSFKTQESIADSPENAHVVALLKRHRDVERRNGHLKSIQEVLTDLTKKGVFGILQEHVDGLGIKGSKDLVTQADDTINQFKTKIEDYEKTLAEERALLFSDAAKTASDLGCSPAELLAGDLFVPSHKPMVNTDEVKKMYEKVKGRNYEVLIPDSKALSMAQRKREEAADVEWKKKAEPNIFGLPPDERKSRCEAFMERASSDIERRAQKKGKA